MPETPFDATVARLNARINWERRDRSTGWRVDLDPVTALLGELGDPQMGFRLVHVAGSKGKGSVSSLVSHALIAAGERVGTYGSPHVESITERVRLDGNNIDESALGVALTAVLDVVEAEQAAGRVAGEASWFDIMTAAALVAFRNAGVTFAVLEVGLGGRLDSTNVIPSPEVAVVTTIALEHTNILGKTHGAIAREKGGIVKSGCHFVSGCDPDSEAGLVLQGIASERGVAGYTMAWSPEDRTFEEVNVRIARAVIEALRERRAVDAQVDGNVIAASRLPGRMERRLFEDVPVVMDGAHVPNSVEMALQEAMAEHRGPFWAVLAVHHEKDAAALAAPILEHAEGLIATTVPGSGVHFSSAELLEKLHHPSLVAVEEPREALAEAVRRARAREGGWVFVTGSLYLVGVIRGSLE
ncbi:Folylpolyglutamate synthase [Planctomycetes bacterium Poly30]|uniref:Dihydrofolate synthase/folylpolyglutamate synthase n=1 Tax=Saltatorellus ferox TaxID=2528018 RepID=A0A518EZR1_9BACT|nr:Folylpolyglutamate synthase [Planctomycetes bacterium Poly30]